MLSYPHQTKMRMSPEKRKNLERGIFMVLIIGLTLYGLKDVNAAEKIIRALTDAFALLFNSINT